MASRDILVIPDATLRSVSAPIDKIDDDVRALVADMFETMYAAPGIGLAAVQVGVPRRIITIDIQHGEERPADPLAFINPELIGASDERTVTEEGCLSIPDYYEEVERAARISVRYLDQDGAARTIDAEGLLATCLQHEIDHLNGVLFIDHLSRLKRERVVKRFTKLAREAERDAKPAPKPNVERPSPKAPHAERPERAIVRPIHRGVA